MSSDDIMENFVFIYNKLLSGKDEDEYVSKIHTITATSFVVMHIKKVRQIKDFISNLLEEHLYFAYKITLLSYIKSDLFNKILECSKINKEINDIHKKLSDDTTRSPLFVVIEISKILKDCLKYICAFNLFPSSLKNENNLDSQGETVNIKYDDLWYSETRCEIINRLEKITLYYGIDATSTFKIKKKHYNVIMNMNYKELVKYYNKCVSRIIKYLTERLSCCQAYIDIDKRYTISVLTRDDNLLSGKFDLEYVVNNTTQNDSDSE